MGHYEDDLVKDVIDTKITQLEPEPCTKKEYDAFMKRNKGDCDGL